MGYKPIDWDICISLHSTLYILYMLGVINREMYDNSWDYVDSIWRCGWPVDMEKWS